MNLDEMYRLCRGRCCRRQNHGAAHQREYLIPQLLWRVPSAGIVGRTIPLVFHQDQLAETALVEWLLMVSTWNLEASTETHDWWLCCSSYSYYSHNPTKNFQIGMINWYWLYTAAWSFFRDLTCGCEWNQSGLLKHFVTNKRKTCNALCLFDVFPKNSWDINKNKKIGEYMMYRKFSIRRWYRNGSHIHYTMLYISCIIHIFK